jgi:hypothetical protein
MGATRLDRERANNMAEAKTKPTKASVTAFLDRAASGERRTDCARLVKMMTAATRQKPEMWGTAIVGFGRYRTTYADGREAEWPLVGFSPRKNDLVVYLMSGFKNSGPMLKKLGKHKVGKSCLYLKSISSIDQATLGEMITLSVEAMAAKRVR